MRQPVSAQDLVQGRVRSTRSAACKLLRQYAQDGYLEPVEDEPDRPGPGRPRRRYALTMLGRALIESYRIASQLFHTAQVKNSRPGRRGASRPQTRRVR